MSYARFGHRESSVYVYPASNGLECCGCALVDDCFVTNSIDQMAAHLGDHEAAGHVVPADVVSGIRADRDWLMSEGIAS